MADLFSTIYTAHQKVREAKGRIMNTGLRKLYRLLSLCEPSDIGSPAVDYLVGSLVSTIKTVSHEGLYFDRQRAFYRPSVCNNSSTADDYPAEFDTADDYTDDYTAQAKSDIASSLRLCEEIDEVLCSFDVSLFTPAHLDMLASLLQFSPMAASAVAGFWAQFFQTMAQRCHYYDLAV